MSRQPANGYRNASNGSTPSLAGGTASSNPRLAASQAAPQQQREASPAMSRAERFEDEKRRIIESCFAKVDQNGQLSESYITHIRITEDAAHPSTPPPPDSPPDNKKPRLIIIAVRSTGRVRMHKARENNNGSFSIGKTWNLEELSAIESFSNIPTAPRDDREAHYRTWAGSVGFILTITKPYYWQAGTSKEKDFFIASAVKIYKKYTKGLVPELRGFDEKDRAAMLGVPPQQQSQSPPPPPVAAHRPPPATAPPDSTSLQPPFQPPFAQREQSRDTSRYRQSPGPPPSDTDSRPPGSSPPLKKSEAAGSAAGMSPPPTAIRNGQTAGGTRSFAAAADQMRSQSREPRPSTRPSPSAASQPSTLGPQVYTRAAPLEPPPPIRPQDRSDSPTIGPSSSGPGRPRSPPQQRSFQPPANGVSETRQNDAVPPETNGIATGPALFASTRQRLHQHQQQSQSRSPPPTQIDGGAPQLPPLEVSSQSLVPQKSQTPLTATSEGSSALDFSDAAAIGALTSFWGPETTAAPSSPTIQGGDASSPTTPERSRRRPPLEPRASESTADLRPAPLSQARKVTNEVPPSAAATLQDHSVKPTPAGEDPAEVKALSVPKEPDPALSVPGAFKSPSVSPAPVQAAAESPVEETKRDSEAQEEEEDDEAFRPGLGPMIKKRAVANKLMKAANTVNAFKPRPGGAAEKILKARAEREAVPEPDGINAVVPRPGAKADEQDVPTVEREAAKQTPTLAVESPSTTAAREPEAARTEQRPRSIQLVDEAPKASPTVSLEPPKAEREESAEEQLPQPQAKSKRRSLRSERLLTELGVDISLLEGKGLEFEGLLDDFGWRGDGLQPKQLAEFESEVKRELGRVEAGSWLSHADVAREEKVTLVETLLDKTIAECDELDGLLTIYSVELGSLNEDIAFIEAQSQGLQVQSANQKVLHSELRGLVNTMSLGRNVMEPLRYADLSQPMRLEEVEDSLTKLYEAVVTMDPSIRSTAIRPNSRSGPGDSELGRMVALREKKEVYMRESAAFSQRLAQHLDFTFTTCINNAKASVMRPLSGGAGGVFRLNKDAYTQARSDLWMYSPVLLFTKEVNPPTWQTIVRMYYTHAKPLYVDAFKQNMAGWKRAARVPSAEEAEALFTQQDKEGGDVGGGGGITSITTRKLPLKRSQTLAKTLRNASGGDKGSGTGGGGTGEINRNSGALMASEVFAAALDEMAPLVCQEQNFFVDMFHLTSLETTDFVDAVRATAPAERRGTNVILPKPMEADREMARRVEGVTEEIFGFFAQELTGLLEWSVSGDAIQGVGVLAAVRKHAFFLQHSSQEFLCRTMEQLAARARHGWAAFVDEQARAIEDTKVRVHKRKGVIGFIKTFPHFSSTVEGVFAAVARADYGGPAECVAEVRRLVDDAYARLNRAMFDSLKIIAKESPGASAAAGKQSTGAAGAGGDDPEDKEMLNHHILLIENMNHYIEEVDDGGREGVLAEWRGRAMMERMEAMEAYVGRVIRRPLGKLLDFVESVESLMASHPHGTTAIASRPSYSRKAARVLLSQHDGKEVRRGIETLRRRIEKHFSEGDEEAISRSLVALVGKECERSYDRVLERVEAMIDAVYPPTEGEKNVELEVTREDVRMGFRR